MTSQTANVLVRLNFPPWPPVLFSPPGYGGDWRKKPLGEILDGNKMQDSGFAAKCLKYNCQCDMDHS